jgi:hypothetical protein
METNKTKFIYASCIQGQKLRVPLPGFVNKEYITQQLLNAGVKSEDLEYASFSLHEVKPVGKLRSSYPSRAEIERLANPTFPAYPKPSSPDIFPAMWSSMLIRKYTPISKLKDDGIPFCMRRGDNIMVNLNSLPVDQFTDAKQYKEYKDGKIGMLYGVAWKLVDTQKVSEGVEYRQELTLSKGMKEVTEFSISATLGASGFGLSASLTATFGQTFEITQSEIFAESYAITGQPKKIFMSNIWQLCDLIYLVKLNENGGYDFIDSYRLDMIDDKDRQFTLSADKTFFGNTEQSDNGEKIITNLTHPTGFINPDVLTFDVA